MEKKKLGMASDHAGYSMKVKIKEYLESLGYEIVDFGNYSEASADYADFAHPLANAIENGELERGIAMCGSGNGINMTLNHHKGIRSALCWIPEIAALAKQHNDANVCTLPARFVTFEEAKAIVDAYLNAEFEGGRHQARIDKIPC
ncbi:ribose 5-phosphate isomerase B [uncultured Acetobacteroides sp.]|uniref:ribose 5-phosphate isomerase B n=1 Tax=uncultured Acetobacteroides sp. TaxID=1760811 RepID=UPI0029F565CA|nr:ribose 5-phosphate isomerase B [uncultured Acetobacteroides sp.]